jgi:hypothetical protein
MPKHIDMFIWITPEGVSKLTGWTDKAKAPEVTKFMSEASQQILASLLRNGIEAQSHNLWYESGDEGVFVLLPVEVVKGDVKSAVDIAAEWVKCPRAAKLPSGVIPKVRLIV